MASYLQKAHVVTVQASMWHNQKLGLLMQWFQRLLAECTDSAMHGPKHLLPITFPLMVATTFILLFDSSCTFCADLCCVTEVTS